MSKDSVPRKPSETLDEYIRHVVDSAPPLSEIQRARLAALLRPAQDKAVFDDESTD